MELVENIYINNKNIPIINLFYRESRIFIESNCYKGHCNINPLNEFLTLYHPLIKFTQNFIFCNQCLLRFFHYNKPTFLTNFCEICNQFYCSHKIGFDSHNLKFIEVIYPKIEFIFPLCPECNIVEINELFCGNVKFSNNYLLDIMNSYQKQLKQLNEIENHFNSLEVKNYFYIYPFYEHFMRMNYLEILLCENLMKTYKFFREKKQMYYPILQNIKNIFNFKMKKILFQSTKYNQIQKLKDYFMGTINCFIQSNLNYIKFKDHFIIISYININFKKAHLKHSKKYYFENCYFFPDIEKILLINKKSMIIFDYMFNKIKRFNYVLFKDILTCYNNLFIIKKENNLYFYELDKKNDFIFKGKYLFINNDIKYHKYVMAKKEFLYCFSYINTKNINKKNNKKTSLTFINYDIDYYDESQNFVHILKFNENLKEIRHISSIFNINFINKLKDNLVLIATNNTLSFYDGEGIILKKISLIISINENQICIYNNKYLFILFNIGLIWLIDFENFVIINSFNFFSKNIFKDELIRDNIVNEFSDNLILYKYKLYNNNKNNNYNSNNIKCTSNKEGIIFLFDNELFFIKNIEKEISVYIIHNYIHFDEIKAGFNQNTIIFLINKKCLNYYNLDLI